MVYFDTDRHASVDAGVAELVRRARLKIVYRKVCGFDSHLRHKKARAVRRGLEALNSVKRPAARLEIFDFVLDDLLKHAKVFNGINERQVIEARPEVSGDATNLFNPLDLMRQELHPLKIDAFLNGTHERRGHVFTVILNRYASHLAFLSLSYVAKEVRD